MKNIFCLIAVCMLQQETDAQNNNQQNQFSWTNLPVIAQPVFKKDTFNIVDYGAVADGLRLNTVAINKAISDCSSKGGGVVFIPGGLWLTGPLEMKSNVNLHIVKAGILMFSNDFNQYPLVEGTYGGNGLQEISHPFLAMISTISPLPAMV